MKKFKPYVTHLESLVASSATLERGTLAAKIDQALDGEPSRVLRERISHDILRKKGIFFTGSKFADRAVGLLSNKNIGKHGVTDPACGAGDLLIAASKKLPVFNRLDHTLQYWGEILSGYDLHEEFIRVTKLRLLLAAISRLKQLWPVCQFSVEDLFPNIRVGDGLKYLDFLADKSAVLVNPPYVKINSRNDLEWAAGKVSQAAVFVDEYVSNSPPGKVITAILPEVLRTGSRYGRWRNCVEQKASLCHVESLGRFDRSADIDVFLLKMIVKNRPTIAKKSSWNYPESDKENVGSLFDVAVGSVVPHRDKKKGPRHFFIHPRVLPAWETVTQIRTYRRYKGRTFESPFVVVRRTSAPRDKYRCVATIVNVNEPVAIENHFLVLSPLDRSLKQCENLMSVLQDRKTNNWLNQRIRCRHLTVSALKELPW